MNIFTQITPTILKMKRILVCLIFIYSVSCNAQNIKFFGNVCDSETRKCIPLATVVSYNGEQVNGTYCDNLGHFSLTFQQLPDSICISSIGYQTLHNKGSKKF